MDNQNPYYNYNGNPDGVNGNIYYVPQPEREADTEETKRFKANFRFFGPVTFLYAVFYAFCMFRNDAGVAFPFFIAGSLWFLRYTLRILGISFKKGSGFYMTAMMLLAISTCCTDDGRMIFFNKAGIFLLMMSMLLKQFFDTSQWKLGKYLLSICQLTICCLENIARPFTDMAEFFKEKKAGKIQKVWYGLLGVAAAIPIVAVVLVLLSSADAVFFNLTDRFFRNFSYENIFNVIFRIFFLYMASYLLTSYLCRHKIKEEVKDRRKGEPIIAITITGMLSVLYLIFSGIQILYLFIGNMQLPEGYTYAEYAREGFFQLLAVGILNLVIVLAALRLFKESRILKIILTVMSLCSFVMIASSAMRMIIYIQYYYLTFLRILVLWTLALLFCLFVGVILEIFGKRFHFFTYSMVTVTVLYIALSFAHPDYLIAAFNVNYMSQDAENWERDGFIQSDEPYKDYAYLSRLSADAAPVLIPYMRDELGMDMADFVQALKDPYFLLYAAGENRFDSSFSRYRLDTFGYFYVGEIRDDLTGLSARRFNVSRFLARRQIMK